MLTTDALSMLEDSQHHPRDGIFFGNHGLDLLVGSYGHLDKKVAAEALKSGKDEALRLQ